MKFRFTIAGKLALGFGILMIAVLSTSYFTYSTLDKNTKINNNITNIYTPSASYLNDLLFMITNTKMLIKIWVHMDKKDDTPDKIRLREIHSKEYPKIKEALAPLVTKWDKQDQDAYYNILKSIDSLFTEHKMIMNVLNNFESYEDLTSLFLVSPKVDVDGDVMLLSDRILSKLNDLVNKQESIVEDANRKMEESFERFQQLVLILGLILVISVLTIGIITTRTLVGPIKYIKNIILQMSKGILPEKKIKGGGDEIGEMSDALNMLVHGLRETSQFSIEIGNGNFNSEFTPLSEDDILGNSLIMMRENLIKAEQDAELRRKENNQRTWASQGLAKFGELLRQNNDNMEEFSYIIISNLVKYLDANQGGMFIVNDDNKDDIFIELAACYAYQRRKYLQKRIDIGVNMVGQCVQEKATIYLTDIPDDYIHIMSGLGEDNPRCLLVVPLITNDQVFGVVEIASFKILEPYQVEFVEKIAENIAATILSVKISNNTSRLLAESQEKSERLARQEEEVRQNVEEMQATQEEMVKKDKEKYVKIKTDYEKRISKLQERIDELERKLQSRDKMKLKTDMNQYENKREQ